MGITERVYRRELERATRELADRFELLRAGAFCESQRSLLLAYVTGVAGPTRRVEARRHLESCPGCASWVIDLRATTRRAAAFVPLPVLAPALHTWTAARIESAAHGVRDRVAGAVTRVRDHGLRALLRADPSRMAAFGGVRPGAVAMLATGCVAAGSTATYCAVEGLPAPIASLVGDSHHSDIPRHPAHHRIVQATPTPRTTLLTPTATPGRSPASPGAAPVQRRTAAAPAGRRQLRSHSTAPTTAERARIVATRVQKATAPEFGLGNGGVTPSVSQRSGGSSATSRPGSSRPGATPKATKPLPEFDP